MRRRCVCCKLCVCGESEPNVLLCHLFSLFSKRFFSEGDWRSEEVRLVPRFLQQAAGLKPRLEPNSSGLSSWAANHSCFILEIIAVRGFTHHLGIMPSEVLVSLVALQRRDDLACYYRCLERWCLISANGWDKIQQLPRRIEMSRQV